MEAYLLQIKVGGSLQTHPRVFSKYASAERLAQKLVRTGAAATANIITISISPTLGQVAEASA